MKYSTILFDADGTLLDFVSAQEKAFYDCCKEFNVPCDEEKYKIYDSINHAQWQRLERKEITRGEILTLRFDLYFQQVGAVGVSSIDFSNRYSLVLGSKCDLLQGAYKMLEAIKDDFYMAIITNGFAATQYRRLDDSNIRQFFKELIISEEVGEEKPSKIFFDTALSRCQVRDLSTVLVVGDSLSADILGANLAGIDSCWFNPDKKENKGAAVPTYTVASYPELMKILYL